MQVRAEWVKKYLQKGFVTMGFFDATMAQKAVYTPIIVQSAEDNECPNIPIGLHQEGDKHNRISAGLTNVFFRKVLFWDETLPKRSAKHYNAFMNQILSFEKGTSANDDAPDTLERAVTLSQTYFGYSSDNSGGKPTIGRRRKSRRL